MLPDKLCQAVSKHETTYLQLLLLASEHAVAFQAVLSHGCLVLQAVLDQAVLACCHIQQAVLQQLCSLCMHNMSALTYAYGNTASHADN